MPAIVGAIQVIAIGSSGVFHVGDVYKITPYSTSKTYAGAGSFNTGESLSVYNNDSRLSINDDDNIDQPIAFTL
ncbi:spore germination protein [Bacillus massiliigorillae]|uniref:spore germination protein n=1 Tax=Bacillus massiliigorillae TaxID=1243664 RepID=UPI000399BEEE|nr:spore germination protein [Bacillus massiliigorillae]